MATDARSGLRADCRSCVGLCCVALPFRMSRDFAIDKDAGQPCPNLRADFGCGIHDRLRASGFAGCVAYDCFGAGQHVSQRLFAGRSWRRDPEAPEHSDRATSGPCPEQMFAVFGVVRQLHELRWYLVQALELDPPEPFRGLLRAALVASAELTAGGPQAVLKADVDGHGEHVDRLLRAASAHARDRFTMGADFRQRDLMGADLRHRDLRGADFRRACLIAADLRGADLRYADVIGADLRDADLSGARLDQALFLTQPQLESARGDSATTLPPWSSRPGHWVRSPQGRPAGPRRRR